MLNVVSLRIPTPIQKKSIVSKFVEDLESFTVLDVKSNTFRPVICCVCDSIPAFPNWSQYVDVITARQLFEKSNMESSKFIEIYPNTGLLEQYSISHDHLKHFVLSPATYINDKEQVLICKPCYSELLLSAKKKDPNSRHPPKQAIANGYVIGNAPVELTCLNEVELSLVSRVRIYCQSWIFYGGCHQHVKGWHTFFKNRNTENVANLTNLSESGMTGMILVVLCGPFTTTQKAMALKKTAVNPGKVINAWRWLKENNIRFKEDEIPSIDSIPQPYVVKENLYV